VTTRALTARRDVLSGLSAPAEGLLPYALGFLAAAGMAELLLLRTLSRVAVHIPKEGLVLSVYRALTGVGSFAFNLATILAVVALALALLQLARQQHRADPWQIVGAGALALLLAWSVLLPLLRSTGEGSDEAAKLAFGLVFSVAVVALALPHFLSRRKPLARRAAVALVGAVALCAQYYTLSYAASGLLGTGGPPPLASEFLALGEVLVVASAGAIFAAWGATRRPGFLAWPHGGRRGWKAPATGLLNSPNRLGLAVPTALSLLLLASYLTNGSTSAILSLWTEGLTLYLPFPVYLAAFWLYASTVVARFQRRDGFAVGCALLLLFVGGYALELTYQHLLAALALLVLTQDRSTDTKTD